MANFTHNGPKLGGTEGSKRGWDDVKANLPFNYDAFEKPADQRNYERGRLRAIQSTLAKSRLGYFETTLAYNRGYLSDKTLIPNENRHQENDPNLTFRIQFDRCGFPLPVPTTCAR